MFETKNFRIIIKQNSPKLIFLKDFKKKLTKFYKIFEEWSQKCGKNCHMIRNEFQT